MRSSDLPRITVVTPSYNQGRYLEATMASVFAQDYPNLEYMVVDGGSTDDSVDIIQYYADRLSYWVSETDSGQSDAIVKGFNRATGNIMNWLNADDLLLPGALFAVARVYKNTGASMIVGQDHHFRVNLERPDNIFRPAGYCYPDCLRFWDGGFRYHQPCTFFTKRIYEKVGGLDKELQYAMDFDMYCRMLADTEFSIAFIEQPISAFRLNPEAKTTTSKPGFLDELREVAQRYWTAAELGSSDARDMNRYCAECSLYQAAESFRASNWRRTLYLVSRSMGFAPIHTLGHTLHRLGRRITMSA